MASIQPVIARNGIKYEVSEIPIYMSRNFWMADSMSSMVGLLVGKSNTSNSV